MEPSKGWNEPSLISGRTRGSCIALDKFLFCSRLEYLVPFGASTVFELVRSVPTD
jgi:hypothetical protein